MKKGKYDWLLERYPEIMSKENLYRVCHVSKRTALFYLEGGLVPYADSGKKTRKYTIRTVDVIDFLERRDNEQLPIAPPSGWYSEKSRRPKTCDPRFYSRGTRLRIRKALERILDDYPDVLTTKQVSDILGYKTNSIAEWCAKGQIEFLDMGNAYLIAKPCLVEFMMADQCQRLRPSTKAHILKLFREIERKKEECTE